MGRHVAHKPNLKGKLDRAIANEFEKRNIALPQLPQMSSRTKKFATAFAAAMALMLVSVVDPYSGGIESASASDGFYNPNSNEGVNYDVYSMSSISFARGGFTILSGGKAAGYFVNDASNPEVRTAQAYARSFIAQYGWGPQQYSCLVTLWNRESNWRVRAENKQSGAYGIPQSLPGTKMASEGSDWQTNPETQIRWGVKYIYSRYATACQALLHSNQVGWY